MIISSFLEVVIKDGGHFKDIFLALLLTIFILAIWVTQIMSQRPLFKIARFTLNRRQSSADFRSSAVWKNRQGVRYPFSANIFRRLIRSSTGGCVEKSFCKPPKNGLMINI